MNQRDHYGENDLERYMLGHLDSIQEDQIEEHLLVCDQCSLSLTWLEEFRMYMELALTVEDSRAEESRQPKTSPSHFTPAAGF